MPAHPLLEKQNVLHAKASSLLEEVLFPILKKYGDISVGGSYAYKLLNHPDIDIDIVNEDCSKELFVALCAELISLEYTSKFTSTDRVHYPHIHPGKRPTGYWVAPTIHFDDTLWKIDIWLQKPEWHTGDTNRYADEFARVDDETRITILSLKQELIEKKLYGVGNEFVSVDVYEGVLRGAVKTVDELRDFVTLRKLLVE